MNTNFDRSDDLRFVFTAPHASPDFGEFGDKTSLTREQQIDYSDFGTDASLPRIGSRIVAEYSRALGDLNRAPDTADVFPSHDFESIDGTRRKIWGTVLSEDERQHLLRHHHHGFHERVRNALKQGGNVLIDWHSMPEMYRLGSGKEVEGLRRMPTLVLSNNGDPGSAWTERPDIRTTCDPVLLQLIAEELPKQLHIAGLPDDIELNTLSGRANADCGLIPVLYNTRTNPALGVGHRVDALQVEYSDAITARVKGEERLRNAFEKTLEIVQMHYNR